MLCCMPLAGIRESKIVIWTFLIKTFSLQKATSLSHVITFNL